MKQQDILKLTFEEMIAKRMATNFESAVRFKEIIRLQLLLEESAAALDEWAAVGGGWHLIETQKLRMQNDFAEGLKNFKALWKAYEGFHLMKGSYNYLSDKQEYRLYDHEGETEDRVTLAEEQMLNYQISIYGGRE